MKIVGLSVSPGHNYFGHHGRPPGVHPLVAVEEVECVAGRGLYGDRFFDFKPDYAGQVTFFAAEVFESLVAELGLAGASANPAAHRRNVITRGVDLNTLIGREFEVQGVHFAGVGECKPCLWMNGAIGPGAEAWLRGRGGLRARILTDGRLRLDPSVPAGGLLAGGQARRMGRDKAGLPWAGSTLGAHQAATLVKAGAWPHLISCRNDQSWTPAGFTRVEDPPGAGGAPAALAGLRAASGADVLLALAVDLPLVPPEFLARLATEARAEGISIVPRREGIYEPLAAAWHRSSLAALQEAAAAHESLQKVCARLEAEKRLRSHDVGRDEERWFLNLNTTGEWMNAGAPDPAR